MAKTTAIVTTDKYFHFDTLDEFEEPKVCCCKIKVATIFILSVEFVHCVLISLACISSDAALLITGIIFVVFKICISACLLYGVLKRRVIGFYVYQAGKAAEILIYFITLGYIVGKKLAYFDNTFGELNAEVLFYAEIGYCSCAILVSALFAFITVKHRRYVSELEEIDSYIEMTPISDLSEKSINGDGSQSDPESRRSSGNNDALPMYCAILEAPSAKKLSK